ncbi:hypothetical protein FACS189442_5580 [Spirochaetia bacterium]|nr:hypothetical protein FACS189442_5580 [Spirochaetia bacterium]
MGKSLGFPSHQLPGTGEVYNNAPVEHLVGQGFGDFEKACRFGDGQFIWNSSDYLQDETHA